MVLHILTKLINQFQFFNLDPSPLSWRSLLYIILFLALRLTPVVPRFIVICILIDAVLLLFVMVLTFLVSAWVLLRILKRGFLSKICIVIKRSLFSIVFYQTINGFILVFSIWRSVVFLLSDCFYLRIFAFSIGWCMWYEVFLLSNSFWLRISVL